MSKITYLNSHLHKFRKEPEYKCDLEDVEALAYYDVLVKEDKKTTKIFMKCFNNKETYWISFDVCYKLSISAKRLNIEIYLIPNGES